MNGNLTLEEAAPASEQDPRREGHWGSALPRIRQLCPCIGGRVSPEGTWAPCESGLWEAHRGHVDPLPS